MVRKENKRIFFALVSQHDGGENNSGSDNIPEVSSDSLPVRK